MKQFLLFCTFVLLLFARVEASPPNFEQTIKQKDLTAYTIEVQDYQSVFCQEAIVPPVFSEPCKIVIGCPPQNQSHKQCRYLHEPDYDSLIADCYNRSRHYESICSTKARI